MSGSESCTLQGRQWVNHKKDPGQGYWSLLWCAALCASWKAEIAPQAAGLAERVLFCRCHVMNTFLLSELLKMKNILYVIAVFFSIFFMTGCAPMVLPYPNKDLVPTGESQAIDGVWKNKENPIYKLRIEKGRGFLEDPLLVRNGRFIMPKDSTLIKNIRKIGYKKYSCQYGGHYNYGGIAYDDGKCEIEIISENNLQVHNFIYEKYKTPESYQVYEIEQLDDEKLFLSSIDSESKNNSLPPVATSTIPQPKDENNSEEISTTESMGSNISSSPDKTATVSSKEATMPTNKEKKKIPKQVISQVQQQLIELSYAPGVADGMMGKSTVNALKKFQLENNLAATGQIDTDTIKILQERLEKQPRVQTQPVTANTPQAEEVTSQPAIPSQPAPETEQDSTPIKVISPLDL